MKGDEALLDIGSLNYYFGGFEKINKEDLQNKD